MTNEVQFRGELKAAHGGGHVVEVDAKAAARVGAKGRTRVRGTFGGATYRSNLVSMGGRLLLGVHTATVRAAGAAVGDVVRVTMELDAEPRDDEIPPEDLIEALGRSGSALSGWDALAPSHRREHIRDVLDAKRPETRARRIAATVAAMQERVGR